MDSILNYFSTLLLHFSEFGYLLAFSIAFLETIIWIWMITPWSSILIFLWGYAATTGNLDFFDLIFFASVWAILWDNINYYLGQKFGNKWVKDWFWIIKSSHFDLGKIFFKKHWWKSVLFGRFIPGVKEVVPLIAWIMKMNKFSFFIYNFFWWIWWAFEFIGFWFIFGGSILLAKASLWRIAFLIFILLIIFLIFSIFKWSIKKYWKIFFKFSNIFFQEVIKFFLKKKLIQKFLKNNPKFIIFLKNRFDKSDFFWLPFTILSFLILYILTEYIWFTDAVLDWELITQIDIRLSDFFYYFKDKRLIDFFLFISYFWNTIIVLFIAIITTIILFARWKNLEIIWFLFSIWISSFIAIASKLIIARPRPELAVYMEKSYSFPSFHATISVALYGFIIWLFLSKFKKWKTRINLIFIWIIIAFLIGFSRLYLNVHYLSDVISGWFLWFLGLTFWITIIWYLKHKKKFISNKKSFLYEFKKLITYSLLILSVIFGIFHYKVYYKNIIFTDIIKNKYTKTTNISDFFNKNPHLKYTETITGRQTEPINFIFIAKNDNEIKKLFIKSSWEEADKIWRTSIKKIWWALIENKEYNTAPMTPLYWNKKIQLYWFQKLTEKKDLKYRHHIRIWKTDYKIWNDFIYVACWIYDDWLKWWITHKIDPDLDKEREYIFSDLKNTWIIKKITKLKFEEWFIWTNFSWDEFFTDGKIYLIQLK